MFGMSAAEMTILLIVGIVVVGPKRLPEMMRKAGQWTVKLRRMSNDLRNQSGIDRILKEEGLEKEIRELRALRESLSKHALFDSLVQSANNANAPLRTTPKAVSGGPAFGPTGPTNPNLPAKSEAPAPALSSSLGRDAAPNGAEGAGAAASQTTASSVSRSEGAAQGSAAEASAATSSQTTEAGAAQARVHEAATSSDGSEALPAAGGEAPRADGIWTSPAGALVKPAPNVVARSNASLPRKPPYKAFREREYPSFGPDHYEAFPDDIDESIDEEDLRAMSSGPPNAAPEAARAEESST